MAADDFTNEPESEWIFDDGLGLGLGDHQQQQHELTSADLAELDEAETTYELVNIAPNGFIRPAYSYSCLIWLSLKNSYDGELTVSEIYAFLWYT